METIGRMFRTLFGLAALALPPGGCVAFYDYRDVTFRVVDGESDRRVAGATVSVSYEPHELFWNKPRDRSAKTDAAGEVTVPVAGWWLHDGPGFGFGAPGYLRHAEKAEPGERLPRGLVRCGDGRRSTCFVIPLYRGPAPEVVLVVPDGFVGPVGVELIPSAGISVGPTGRRRIELNVPPSGHLATEADPLLRQQSPARYGARRAGGEALPRPYFQRPDEHALRWVMSDFVRGRHLFVVGPESLAERVKRDVMDVTDRPKGGVLVEQNREKFDRYFQALAARDG